MTSNREIHSARAMSALWSGCILIMATAGALNPVPAAPSAALQSLEAEGTQFKATLADGRVLRSRELVGATLTIARHGMAQRIRIDAVETDRQARRTAWDNPKAAAARERAKARKIALRALGMTSKAA